MAAMKFENLFLSSTLKILDAGTGEIFAVDTLKKDYFDKTDGKSLIFAYLDNSIESLSFLISSLCSEHTVALFSNELSTGLKNGLEQSYTPYYIFDAKREDIPNYSYTSASCFKRLEPFKLDIDKNIKLLLSTSGTTGSPKLVKLSEENIISNAISIGAYLPIEVDDVVPLNLPLNYSYGLSILTSNSLIGNTIVCGLPDVLSKEFWRCFSNYGFSTLAGVPFVYEMLDRIGFLKKEYPSLKYLTQAGGRLRDSLMQKFASYAENSDIEFFVMYGQTEATARMSYMPPNHLLKNIGSIGKPIPGGNFTIDDKNNELIYSGPNVYGGYANTKMDLTNFERKETLRTGDLAEINENGFYLIKGRSKRFVKLFGNRINLDEVQRSVSDEFERQIICFGIDDLKLVLAHQNMLDEVEIKKWLNKEYKIHQGSIDFLLLGEIPQTQNGKIHYQKLMEIYGS